MAGPRAIADSIGFEAVFPYMGRAVRQHQRQPIAMKSQFFQPIAGS
jgi:hypothetical protein